MPKLCIKERKRKKITEVKSNSIANIQHAYTCAHSVRTLSKRIITRQMIHAERLTVTPVDKREPSN